MLNKQTNPKFGISCPFATIIPTYKFFLLDKRHFPYSLLYHNARAFLLLVSIFRNTCNFCKLKLSFEFLFFRLILFHFLDFTINIDFRLCIILQKYLLTRQLPLLKVCQIFSKFKSTR